MVLSPERAKREAQRLRKEVIEKVSSLATAAFGLVAALAWNSAIQELFKQTFPQGGTQLGALLAYALFVTAIAVVATIWIGRVAGRAKGEAEAESTDLP